MTDVDATTLILRCAICCLEMPAEKFSLDRRYRHRAGRDYYCRSCRIDYKRRRRRAAGAKPRPSRRSPDGRLRCSGCKIVQHADQFRMNTRDKTRVSLCRVCERQKHKRWVQRKMQDSEYHEKVVERNRLSRQRRDARKRSSRIQWVSNFLTGLLDVGWTIPQLAAALRTQQVYLKRWLDPQGYISPRSEKKVADLMHQLAQKHRESF